MEKTESHCKEVETILKIEIEDKDSKLQEQVNIQSRKLAAILVLFSISVGMCVLLASFSL